VNKPDMSIFNELSEFIAIRMSSCKEETHGGDWIEHKAHLDYDLWFIQSGTVSIHMDGIEHAAMPGDVVFFYPGVAYRATAASAGCRFIYAHFDFGIGGQQRILDDFPLSGVISNELIREEAGLFCQSYCRSKQQDDRPGNRLYLRAGLTAVIARIIEIHSQGRYSGAFAKRGTTRKSGRSLEVLQPIFKYVHDHLNESIRMSELAALAGISEKYFISYFKQALGITPGQYIYQIKMNRARDYLYEKQHTVQQIAGLLGYPDPFTFSKAFKKYYKVPPSRFV